MKNRIGYIYILSWVENRENRPFYNSQLYYVGQHHTYSDKLSETDLINDGYFGSGKVIRSFKRQYEINEDELPYVITKEILEYPIYGDENIDESEREYIKEYQMLYGDYLVNLEEGGTKEKDERRFLNKSNKNV